MDIITRENEISISKILALLANLPAKQTSTIIAETKNILLDEARKEIINRSKIASGKLYKDMYVGRKRDKKTKGDVSLILRNYSYTDAQLEDINKGRDSGKSFSFNISRMTTEELAAEIFKWIRAKNIFFDRGLTDEEEKSLDRIRALRWESTARGRAVGVNKKTGENVFVRKKLALYRRVNNEKSEWEKRKSERISALEQKRTERLTDKEASFLIAKNIKKSGLRGSKYQFLGVKKGGTENTPLYKYHPEFMFDKAYKLTEDKVKKLIESASGEINTEINKLKERPVEELISQAKNTVNNKSLEMPEELRSFSREILSLAQSAETRNKRLIKEATNIQRTREEIRASVSSLESKINTQLNQILKNQSVEIRSKVTKEYNRLFGRKQELKVSELIKAFSEIAKFLK